MRNTTSKQISSSKLHFGTL